MDPFIYLAVAISAVVLSYLGFRLTGLGHYSWVLATTMIAIVLSYPLVWFGRLPEKIDSILRAVTHFDIALVSVLIGLLVIRDGIFLPLKVVSPKISRLAFSSLGTGIILFFAALLLIYGYWNAARGPRVVEVHIPIKALPAELQNFSIVQISDLHAGAGIDEAYVASVVQMTNELNPDALVLTGDIGDGNFITYGKSVEPLRQLTEKIPAFYVSGNHEYIKDSASWFSYFAGMGMTMLDNSNVVFSFKDKKILFAGVVDPAAAEVRSTDGPDLIAAKLHAESVDLKILLAHQPNIAVKAEGDFDLQISGHTHGGQFFPWNFIIHLIQKFPRGLFRHKSMWVYVNEGTGYWGPPVRIGTRSEITRIRFTTVN